MPEHTKEPWAVNQYNDGRTKYGAIQLVSRPADASICRIIGGPVMAGANAARIVACVNACVGINPAAVPKLLAACERLLSYMEAALQRPGTKLCLPETVRYANGRIDADASSSNTEYNHVLKADIDDARAAVAEARGEA